MVKYALWAGLALSLACQGEIGDADDRNPIDPDPGPRGPVTCVPPEVGAPVPMRRLTAAQLEATVHDVLGVDIEFPVSDDALLGYRSNTSSSLDTTSARTLMTAAEETTAAATTDLMTECGGDCLAYLLDEIGFKLFRRPLDSATRDRYSALYDLGLAEGGDVAAFEWTLQAMLQSPHFLYLIEEPDAEGRLDGYALASRLSYALWGSGPDQALLDAAAAGTLATDEGVMQHANRLIDDARFDEGLEEFVVQWLEIENLEDMSERPDFYELPAETREALEREPVRFLAEAIRDSGTLGQLLTSTETTDEPALAEIYGDHVMARTDGRAQLDPTKRAGILTLPGVQAALSHARASSPSVRGRAVLANLLCTPPPAPPPGVVPSLPPASGDETTRERLERHFTDPTCATCHAAMDGIGFTFEGYDWLGRGRTEELGRPIDTSGEFLLGDSDVVVDDAIGLTEELAESWDVAVCVASQWTRYATGIRETADSVCLIDHMAEDAREEGGLRAMIMAYVTSDWFRRVTPTGGEE